MRIAQLANFYSPTSGGLRVAVDHLGAGYRAAGDETTLVIPASTDRVHVDGSGACTVGIRSPLLPNESGYRVILRRSAVLDALDHAEPDIIEVHDKLLQRWVWQWARARGVPVVAVSHERLDATLRQIVARAPRRLTDAVAARVAGKVVAESDLVVVCSRFAAQEFGPIAGVRVVPLGVDLRRFRPKAAGVVLEPAARLVSVGRLSKEKRPDVALDALHELVRRGVRAQLSLIGAGPLESRLRERARGLPVRFVGHLSKPSDVADVLAAADIALAPGPAETFGLAALEALACGTPVVTVARAGTSEFVETEPLAGRAAALSAPDFADAVEALLALDENDRRTRARAVAERYTWQASIARMRAVHAELGTQPGIMSDARLTASSS